MLFVKQRIHTILIENKATYGPLALFQQLRLTSDPAFICKNFSESYKCVTEIHWA